MVRTVRLALGVLCFLGGRLGLLWHHQRAQLGIRGQHTMEPNQVQPRPGNQRVM